MSANNDKMPETVFLGPSKHRQQFKYMVFLVVKTDKDGIPTILRMIKEDEEVQVDEGSQFITGYIPITMTQPHLTKTIMESVQARKDDCRECQCGHTFDQHPMDLDILKLCCTLCECKCYKENRDG